MGTGKTTVGTRVARRTGRKFIDADDVIEQKAGKKISMIFAEDGEPRFRELEKQIVKELSARDGLVIATGGGVVLNPENVRNLSSSGTVVCLSATPDAILARVGHQKHRPLLETGDKRARIVEVMEARNRLYGAIPIQVDTTLLTRDQVVEQVLKATGEC